MSRVVITGIGIYSSLGKNREEVTQSLFEGRSGIILDPARKAMGYRSGLTGFVERPQLKGLLDRRSRIMMPEHAEFAYMSTIEAMAQAGMTTEFFEENDTGIIFGNDSCAQPVIEGIDLVREKKDTMLVGSGSVFQVLNSTVTMNLATIFKLRGVNFTISAACALSRLSSITVAAPPPGTSPSRSLSKGRLARAGSSSRVEKVPSASKLGME